ncbi:hypothetical protein Scep_009344 [Stephania cephalantha]|uniref:Uncharacterized protein n=1 Tax=Stephania cephalantha TaxID=152367 RepID=A0AAP0JSZ2_9MAGN
MALRCTCDERSCESIKSHIDFLFTTFFFSLSLSLSHEKSENLEAKTRVWSYKFDDLKTLEWLIHQSKVRFTITSTFLIFCYHFLGFLIESNMDGYGVVLVSF